MSDVDVGDRLREGKWLAVLYHIDGSTCREAVPAIERMASSRPVAFLEMPPYASADERLTSINSKALIGRLSDARDWFATTPVVLLLHDGIVRDVVQGERAVGLGVDWEAMRFLPAR
jgi:hypothetical protein